jgi:hypothetical protein
MNNCFSHDLKARVVTHRQGLADAGIAEIGRIHMVRQWQWMRR